jgi:cobalt-zinc-cadmium efflux system outer membrane protein
VKAFSWWLVCGIAVCVSAASAEAQPRALAAAGTVDVTLASALEVAWQRAVAARESEGQRQRAIADRSAAASWWPAPPALELRHRSDRLNGNAGERESEVAVSMPLWLPGQRGAREGAANAAFDLADEAIDVGRLRLAADLRETAWALAAERLQQAQADALVDVLATLAKDVERRVEAGDLARADALAARAELLAASAQQAEVRQRLITMRGRWTVLTGLDAIPRFAVDDIDGQVDGSLAIPVVWATHPELRFAAATTELARRRVQVAQSSRRESPELLIGVRQDVAGRGEPSRNSIDFGIKIPFESSARNLTQEAAALAELDIARTTEERVRDKLVADLATSRAALDAARHQLAAERERSSMLNERAMLIDKSFRAGESALPDLLRALAAAKQAEASLVRQQAALALAHARVQQALGVLP